MSKPSQMIALVEDERHEMLLRRFLTRCGMERHQVRFERSPSGEGSGERWVRTRFVREVNAYRSRRAKAATALIVMIDADTHTSQKRLQHLSQTLREARIQPIQSHERIAQLTPRRNVETWILCLNRHGVDELTDYKKTRDDWNEMISPAAEALFQWTRPGVTPPSYCVNSLEGGVRELNRLAV